MAAHVFLNHGRWMLACPFCGLPWAAKGITFLCGVCQNKPEGCPVEVYWPPDKKMDELRRIMRVRPVEAQNWQEGDLTAHLLAENIEQRVETI